MQAGCIAHDRSVRVRSRMRAVAEVLLPRKFQTEDTDRMGTALGDSGAPVLLVAFLVSAGVVLYTGIQTAIVGFARQRLPLYLEFSVICFCAAGYQLATAGYYVADSVLAAAEALRWQMAFVLLFHPAAFLFIAHYTGQRSIKPWLALLALIFGALTIVNFATPHSLRFSALEAAAPLRMPWGETLSSFTGELGIFHWFARVSSLGIFLWAAWRTVVQYRRRERRTALFLAASLLLVQGAFTEGLLIDLGVIKFVYLGAFAWLGIALLMSVCLGMELRDKSTRLAATAAALRGEVRMRSQTEDAIKRIAAGVSSETGRSFFRRLVKDLAALFGAEYAFVSGLEDTPRKRTATLAVWARGEFVDNFSYPLDHTPCADVFERGVCVYPHGIRRLFPADPLLRDWEAESFIGTPLLDAEAQPLGLIVLLDRKPMQDTTMAVEILNIFASRAAAEIRRLRVEDQMRRMAYEDYLTGLANRAALHEHLSEAIKRAVQSGRHGAMLLTDLDHFKTINDALGHDVGDQVLREVARTLTRTAGEQAFVARLGGDEFVMVMHRTHADAVEATSVARRLGEAVEGELSRAFTIDERVFDVGASTGIALFPSQGDRPIEVLRHADMALYRAKQRGRNTIQLYEPAMQASAEERLQLERGLRAALEQDQFRLHFQPQVDAAGRVTGAEALLRWRHPQRGDIPPSSFIPVAEETGLIHATGGWVLKQACERLTAWRAGGAFGGSLSINVSPWQFARPDYVRQVQEVLARHRMDPRDLTLEITESAMLYDRHETTGKLHALRAMGLKVALDDFGTGYSSLAYLKGLPLDQLKIDKSFVHSLAADADNALLGDMIAIGLHAKLQVIAEGIESELHRDLLTAMGCEHFQGYLFSPPLPEPEFLRWIAERRPGQRRAAL